MALHFDSRMKCEVGAYRRDLCPDVTLNKNNFEVFGFLTVTNLSVHSYNFVSDFSQKKKRCSYDFLCSRKH